MKKAGKSVWRRIGEFLVFGLILKSLHIFFKSVLWLLRGLWNTISKHAASAMQERKRPGNEAKYSNFEVLESANGKFEDFERYIMQSKSSIGIILGARGTGKSALGMRILENVHAKSTRKVAAMGFSAGSIPKWIQCVEKIDEIRNGSFVLVDEGGIVFSARQSLSDANKILSELLLIARHKDLSVLFISQNSSNLDINTLRQADYLLLRKPSLLQKDFERKIIQVIYEEQEENFKKLGGRITLIHSDYYKGFISNELP